MNKRELGKMGEDIAADFLETQDIKIIRRNYFTKYGEIDLIGFKNKTIIFTEVKLRNNNKYGLPVEAITENKIKRYQNAAQMFILENNILYDDMRFDVICLYLDENNKKYKIEWLKNQYFI